MPAPPKTVPSHCRQIAGSGLRPLAFAIAAACALALTLPAGAAQAKEEFAKQTGQPCDTCHTHGYPLTPKGQAFKANGFRIPCRRLTLRLYDGKGRFLRTHQGCFPTWGPKVSVGQ